MASTPKTSKVAAPSEQRGRLTPAEVRAAIHDICLKHNYNPFEEMIKLATETQTMMVDGVGVEVNTCDVDQRITLAKELAGYLAPKLKNIEVTADTEKGMGIQIQVVRFTEQKVVPVIEASKAATNANVQPLLETASEVVR